MLFDPLYLLLTLPALAFSLWAQWKVKSTFSKFQRVGVSSRMSGAEAAAAVLRMSGVAGLKIERHQGFLSDHYDPTSRTLRLSPDVYDGASVSAVAVAAHEAGHALQHAANYGPLTLRSKLVPVVQYGSALWYLPFLLGSIFNLTGLMWVGIVAFSAIVLFQLVTLPTEFDASSRARSVLLASGIVTSKSEEDGVAKVLNAAAMTYVAALVASLMQLLYMILRAQNSRD
ncbi:MAG: zinc metallopeptidase [Planctomycetes bacterium]|nr:zinc metallopeptidase [Planctomycetota bacterium]